MINTARHTGTRARVCVWVHVHTRVCMCTHIFVSLGCMQGQTAWWSMVSLWKCQWLTNWLHHSPVCDGWNLWFVCAFRNTCVWCHFPRHPHLSDECWRWNTIYLQTAHLYIPRPFAQIKTGGGLDVRYMGVWGLITQAWKSEFNPQTKVKCPDMVVTSVNVCNPTPTATWEVETGEWARNLWASLECTLQRRKWGALCQQGRSYPWTSTNMIRP